MQAAQAVPASGLRRLWRLVGLRWLFEDREYSEWFWAYVFLAPAVVFFGTFTVLPVIRAFVFSFQDFGAFQIERPFVGLYNYWYVVNREPLFWNSLRVSATYTIGTVPPAVLIPLGLAALINRLNTKWQTFFKSAFYIPGMAAGVTIAIVWVWILYPTEGGLANQFLMFLGFDPHPWLADVNTALPSLIFMSIMGGWGGGIILYLATMAGIPKSLYEAADMDCASGWKKFTSVTMPLIKPIILFMIIGGLIGSFQFFEGAYVTTMGGPQNSTTSIVYLIFRMAFLEFQFGKGAAASIILAGIILGLSYFQFRWFATQVEY